jgi:hypothetical protein
MNSLHDWAIKGFVHKGDYVLELNFADNTRQVIDFEPVLRGTWLGALKDLHNFKKVKLNEAGNLEWPDGQDFNPEALYNWPAFKQAYIQDALNLEKVETTTSG